MLLEKALEALVVVTDPERLAIIVLGVCIGLVIGVIPGIGGLVGLALLLPFTFGLDPYTALAFLIGLSAVTHTSDTIPSVLFGVPGTVGSAATVLDGYPMARRGEAGRAFGAAFTASVLGGLFGALLLAVSIPVLRPVMLSIGTPELLAVCALGLTLVAAVSQGSVVKGLIAACLGVLLAAIGDEEQTGRLRWTFDLLYLWDGIPLVSLALGLFAIPELVDLAISRSSVVGDTRTGMAGRQQLKGMGDVMRNWTLVVRSSAIGSVLGSIPGIGAAVIDWIAYGSAARTLKGASTSFGTGDVRGVIASESANNAKEGGALIPTLAFGVPGSASMALLLGAFMMHGIAPGPKLLDTQLDITYTLIWSVALANIVGAGICFVLAGQLAKVATVRPGILVPVVLCVTVVGAFQGARDYGDLVVLFGFGALGWFMKRFGWSRPPLVLGFVLGGLIENYLFISILRYDFDWMARPGVIAIGVVILATLVSPLWSYFWNRARRPGGAVRSAGQDVVRGGGLRLDPGAAALWGGAALVFVYAILSSSSWDFAARLMPQTVAGVGLLVLAVGGVQAWLGRRTCVVAAEGGAPARENDPLAAVSAGTIRLRAAVQALWILGLLAGVLLIGMLPALAVFMFAYMVFEGRTRWPIALAVLVPVWLGMFFLFDQLLNIPWPDSVLGSIWPGPQTPLVRRLL